VDLTFLLERKTEGNTALIDRLRRPGRILVWRQPVDMRKSFDGLVGLVRGAMQEDPLSGSLFVFVNRRGNYLKLVYWDRTGYALFAKRLERGRFTIPGEDDAQQLTQEQFLLILDGITLGRRARR